LGISPPIFINNAEGRKSNASSVICPITRCNTNKLWRVLCLIALTKLKKVHHGPVTRLGLSKCLTTTHPPVWHTKYFPNHPRIVIQ
jgi:hypothetical protein